MAGLMTAAVQERSAQPQMQGLPDGVSVSPAEPGEQMASPEEQALYERFTARAIEMIYDERMMPRVLDMMRTRDPKQGLASATAAIVTRVAEAASKADQEVGPDILLHAGVEILEDLGNLATVAGIYNFNADQDALEGAMFLALDEFRLANADRIDPEPFRRDLAEMDRKDKAGVLKDEFMAMPGAGPSRGGMEAGEPEEMASDEIPSEDDTGEEMDEDDDEDEDDDDEAMTRRRGRG